MILIPELKTVISFINDTAKPDCMPSRSSESYTIYNVHKIVTTIVCSTYYITFDITFLHARVLQYLAAIKLHLNKIKTEIMLQQSLITTEGTRGTQKRSHWYQSIMDTPSKN